MDLDPGGRQLAGLILDAAGRGEHDQVASLIAPLDAERLRSLVTVLAVQVDQSAPASSATGPAAVCELAINAAAPMFGTTPEAILSAERRRPVSDARAVAMTAARETGLSLPAIAEQFNKDHGSVIHAVRRTAERPRLADAAARVSEHVNSRYTARLPRTEENVVDLPQRPPASTFEPDGPVEHAVLAAAEALNTTPEVPLGADRSRAAADAQAVAMTAARIHGHSLPRSPGTSSATTPRCCKPPAASRRPRRFGTWPPRSPRISRAAGQRQRRPARRRRSRARERPPLPRVARAAAGDPRCWRAAAAEGGPVKALIGLAAAAVLALSAGGIKAAIPGVQSGPESAEGKTSQVRVTAVVDGDTIRVETLGGRQLGRVRLLGIDAPEVAHPLEPSECYAADATRLLERLAPVGSTVDLVTDTAQPSRDRYDRLLRYVDHDAVDVARELLASGAARRYEADQALAREESYAGAVDDAQGAERGLWGSC